MKKYLDRQIIVIPVLYVVAKILWDSIHIGVLPDVLKGVMTDLLGPLFIMAIVVWTFIYIFWKVPVLGKLSQFLFGTKPNIQGTWQGQLKYEWEGKNGEKTVYLVVKQINGYALDIWLLTDERTSSSIFADIFLYKSTQRIIYTYSNEESPDNQERNPSHEGLCQIDIADELKLLKGIYYTNRRTFGKLYFDKRNKKTVLDFEKARKLFRM